MPWAALFMSFLCHNFSEFFLECLIFLKIVRKNQNFLKILTKKLKILYFPKNALGSPFYAIFMPKFFRIFWECLIFLKIVWKKSKFFDILLNKSQIYQIPHIWVKYRTTAQRKFSTHTGVQIPHKLAVSRTFWQLWRLGFCLRFSNSWTTPLPLPV